MAKKKKKPDVATVTSITGSSSSKPKKAPKKKPVPVATVSAIGGGQEVRESTKTAKQAAKTYKRREKTTAAGVVSTEERKKASKSTRKQATKADRKVVQKEVGIAKAFRGTKKPEGKKERQAAAKGKAIASILASSAKERTVPNNQLQNVPTAQVRVAQISSLRKQRESLEKDLAKTPKKESYVAGRQLRKSKVQSQLDRIDFNISRLKRQQVQDVKRDVKKNIKKLEKWSDKSGIPQGQVKQQLQAQQKGLKELKQKEERLSGKVGRRRKEAQKSKKQFASQSGVAIESLEGLVSDAGDVTAATFLKESGIRARGKGRSIEVKIPGGDWQPFELAKQSGALEDALNTASWFAPIPAFKGLQVAGGAGRIAVGAKGLEFIGGKGARIAVPTAKVISKAKAATLPFQVALRGGKAGVTGRAVGNLTRPYRVAFKGRGQLRAARATAPALREMGLAREAAKRPIQMGDSIATGAGDDIIERVGKVQGRTSQAQAHAIAETIDQTITSGAKAIVGKVPLTVSEGKLLAYGAAGKVGKLAGAGGGTVALPLLLDDDADAAKNIYRDTYDLITGFVPSTYEALAAGFEATPIPGIKVSDTRRAEELWELAKEHDPIALAVQGRWDEALDAWVERPVSTALELAGAEYAIGRVAGAGLRAIPATKGIASLQRDLKLGPEATKAILHQYYSPDILRKYGQLLGEKIRPARQREMDLQREIYKRVDEEEGVYRYETARMWTETTKEFSQLFKKVEKIDSAMPDAMPFIVSRLARRPETAVADLMGYRAKLIVRQDRGYSDARAETIGTLNRILARPDKLSDSRVWEAARDYIKAENKRQDELIEISSLNKVQSEFAKWIPYMVYHLGAKFDEGSGKWILAEQLKRTKGKFGKKKLDAKSYDDLQLVINQAKRDGIDEPGFFRMQSLDEVMFGATKRTTGKAPHFMHRSGEAVRNGMFDPTFSALFSHSMRLRQSVNEAARLENYGDLFSPYRRGELMRQDSFDAIQKQLKKDGLDATHVPFNMESFKMKLAQLRGIGDDIGDTPTDFGNSSSGAVLQALEQAVKSGPRDVYVAMPKQVLKRLESHSKVETSLLDNMAMRGFQKVTREFKGGVLPFNPRWQFGNIFDMTFRAMMDQTGPTSYLRGKAILRNMKKNDPEAWHEIMDRLGSGYMSEAFMRSYEDLTLQPNITVARGKLGQKGYGFQVRTLRSIWRSPPEHMRLVQRSAYIAKGLLPFATKFYRGLQQGGFGVARIAERQYRTAQLGKESQRYIRNIEENWTKSILLTPKAIEDWTMRVRSDSNVQAALGRNVNRVMGDYTRLSPELRRAVMTYAPFALWFRASTTWVLSLPAKHPAKTALITSINSLKEPERRAMGLSEYNPLEQGFETGMEGLQEEVTKPSFMQGSLAIGGDLFPTETLTSFGTFYGSASDFTDFLVPQISSALMVSKGVYWTGETLVYPDGSEPTEIERLGIGLSNLVETYFPAAKWYKNYRADGAPDETATFYSPLPSGGLRDTYVSPFPNAPRYEAPPENWFQNSFSPFRQFQLGEPSTPSTELSPAPYGKAAEMAGAQEAESQQKSTATGKGWLEGEEALEEIEATEPKRKKVKPKQGWLQSEFK